MASWSSPHEELGVEDQRLSQHRKMIDILNHLHGLLNHETLADPNEEAGQVFDELAEYVVTHFAYEEDLMAEAGYPVDKVAEHKRQHETLLGRVQEVMLAYLYGDWLIKHICHSDKEYSPYMQGLARS